MANPIVTFEMQDGGKIVAELYPDIAPQSCTISSPWPTPGTTTG